MAEAVVISGFVGLGIDIVNNQILRQIGIAIRYKKELRSLERLVTDIQPIIKQIQQYRPALNRKNGIPTSQCHNKASAVHIWLKKLELILRQGSEMVNQCTIPWYKGISRHVTSRKISGLISDLNEHLKMSPLVGLAQIPELLEEHTQVLLEGFGQIMKENIKAVASSSSSSATRSQSLASTGFFIAEPLIVGQETAFATVEKLVIDSDLSHVGVVGKGGSGKSLLLKRIFNCEKVRNVFSDGLLLWLTVSQSPSYKSLGKELFAQIAMQLQTNVHDLENNMNPEGVKVWMNQSMQAKRFALFVDDVWGEGEKLLEELGVPSLTDPSNSKVIVSSRDHRVLREMWVNARSTMKMEDLIEDESWRLFAHHAFPYNNRNQPAIIEERTARLVCAKCGGLPLAIKAVGRSMAGITDPKEWEFAVERVPITNSQDLRQALYDPLRWSYDALGRYDVNLQLCFLYLSAFREDHIIWIEWAIVLFIGEGLLARNNVQDERSHDPFEVGRIYINFLADRCLIEPTLRDVDGCVVFFRVHDILRDLAIQIAEREENFYWQAGKGLAAFTQYEWTARTRFMLSYNSDLSSLPESLRAPEISSLIMFGNSITEIPRKVIGSMVSLKVLDLSGQFLQSLPESVGCLKELVCLKLKMVPMRRLPASLTDLAILEILDVCGSKITELPSDIHRLRSLRYLGLHNCEDLQSLPSSMSLLTSLQHLLMNGCSRVWTNCSRKKSRRHVASLNDLQSLTKLKRLHLDTNGEVISEGTLRNLEQIETLHLRSKMMENLPNDIIKLSKLRFLSLECPSLVKMESTFSEFLSLNWLELDGCDLLEELPDLHKLINLRKLQISSCPKLKKLPGKFGEKGAFPLLKIFSLTDLKRLEKLPIIEEGAMSSLTVFTIMSCEALKMLSKSYLNLKNLEKIRVWGCSLVLENLEEVKKTNTTIKIMTMTRGEDMNTMERHDQIKSFMEDYIYNEFWCNEFSLFLKEMRRYYKLYC